MTEDRIEFTYEQNLHYLDRRLADEVCEDGLFKEYEDGIDSKNDRLFPFWSKKEPYNTQLSIIENMDVDNKPNDEEIKILGDLLAGFNIDRIFEEKNKDKIIRFKIRLKERFSYVILHKELNALKKKRYSFREELEGQKEG
jgi:hypothetical protein